MIDPTKDNFTQPLSIKEILDELEISKENYYRALSVSKDEVLELRLKRGPNSCFVNNYFDFGFKAWQANMDIQPVFNEYKAVTYMCQYFSKTEDRYSHAMKQAVKEAFENNIKTPKRRHCRRTGVFIVNFEHISHLVLVFLLLSLNM